MNRRIATFILFAAALAISSTVARAGEPSCSTWNWQQDGTYWQQCVYDDGSRKCFKATDANGSGAYEVSCSS